MKIKNKQARSFVVIMVVIAVSGLLLRVGIEGLIKRNIVQNESNALVNLKLISAALESYAKDNRNSFPASLYGLTQTQPPYLDKDYISQSPFRGYNYTCAKLESSGYSCSAFPVKCNLTGGMSYTISTGGLFVSEQCSK